MTLMADSSGGVPRTINNLCFNTLSLGCALKKHSIGTENIREVIADLDVGRWKKNVSLDRPRRPFRSLSHRLCPRPRNHAMSRRYQLMEELERDRAFFSTRFREPVFPLPGDHQNDPTDHRAPSELILLLVQRVFLKRAPVPRMVVFAAVDHGNGCSQIAALVAKTLTGMATGGVCLVEANFHSPALPGIPGTTNYRGLSDALREPGNITSFAKPVSRHGLWMLSSGPIAADAANLLNSERMTTRSADLRKAFDFVIVDAPPLAHYPEATALGRLSDGVVLGLEAGSTRRNAARKAVEIYVPQELKFPPSSPINRDEHERLGTGAPSEGDCQSAGKCAH
jgi:Mrp family chromosome partitioning ATPase